MKIHIPTCLLTLITGLSTAHCAPDLHLFDYDAKAPLDFRDNRTQSVGAIAVHDISYASPKGGRVPAFLVVPQGNGPFAGIIFVHWGQGNRTEFLSEALILARAGAESLLIDGVFNRPGGQTDDFAHPEKEKQGYIQLVTDIRRGVDLLQSRPDTDPKRIGYVGHSYGATWGGALAGVEHRICAFVLMGGLPQYGDLSDNQWLWDSVTKRYSKEQIDNYIKAYAPLEPKNFVGLAPPSTVFFQFAEQDQYITPGLAKTFWDAAREPKLQKSYFTSHEFNDPKALADRDQFLEHQLKLKPVLPILEQQFTASGQDKISRSKHPSTNAAEVGAFLDRLNDTGLRRDVSTLDQLYTDEYFHTNPDGSLMTKPQVLDSYRAPAEATIESLRHDDDKIWVRNSLALINTRLTISGRYKGEPYTRRWRVTYIFEKRSDGWRALNSHGTLILPKP